MKRFLLTTDPGIEDVAIDEIREACPGARARSAPYGSPGHVRVETGDERALFELGTVHHIVEIRQEAEADSLASIREIVAETGIPELAGAPSFRVTTERRGEHGFERVEIAGAAGWALQRRYGTPVDLEGFEINVRVNLYGRQLVIGLQRTRDPLSERIRRPRALRTSLKATIAAALLRLAGAHLGSGRLIDPMCGSGTIPVEAHRINPALQIVGTDWDEKALDVARGTVGNHGIHVDVRLCDARLLAETLRTSFHHIVTDPPYGVRQARKSRLVSLYRSLLVSFENVLEDSGRIALVVLRRRPFLNALESTRLRIAHERIVVSSGLELKLFVLEHP